MIGLTYADCFLACAACGEAVDSRKEGDGKVSPPALFVFRHLGGGICSTCISDATDFAITDPSGWLRPRRRTELLPVAT